MSPAVSALTEELHQRSDQKTPLTIYAGDGEDELADEITRQFVRVGPTTSDSDAFGSDEASVGVGEVRYGELFSGGWKSNDMSRLSHLEKLDSSSFICFPHSFLLLKNPDSRPKVHQE